MRFVHDEMMHPYIWWLYVFWNKISRNVYVKQHHVKLKILFIKTDSAYVWLEIFLKNALGLKICVEAKSLK